MDKFPSEILEIILSYHQLNYEDILNFGATCKYFHNFVRENSYIWKRKYEQRYSLFLKYLDKDFNDWRAETLYISELKTRIYQLLSQMSPRFYLLNELSACDFEDWKIVKESSTAYHYTVFELRKILVDHSPINSIKVVPIETPGNRTLQYYAFKVLKYLHQEHLADQWEEYMQLPSEKHVLEKTATFVAQWCQPMSTFVWNDIVEVLDGIAQDVIIEIRTKYPMHPILQMSEEIFKFWKDNHIDTNQWNVTQCQQIMECLIFVFTIQHEFHGNRDTYYAPENSYINEVLANRSGLPILLSVVFESIARRLGLKCIPYSFDSHFLLKFTEGTENEGDSYYIDGFNNCRIIREGQCPYGSSRRMENPHPYEPCTPKQVVQRMANNLEVSYRQNSNPKNTIGTLRTVLELIYLLDKKNIGSVLHLSRLYMMHGIDTKPLELFLTSQKCNFKEQGQIQCIVHLLQDYDVHRAQNVSELLAQPKYKVRPKNLKYAVGMVMEHVVFNRYCIIYGWDTTCMASLEFQKELGVLRHGRTQPYYKILLTGGTHYYAPQEFLQTCEPVEMQVIEDLGKYFSHYFQTHYVPNAEKEYEYPGDAEVRHRFHQKIQCNSKHMSLRTVP